MTFKKKLESLPQRQIGVREQSNIRMKKFARPICPVIEDEDDKRYDVDRDLGQINCQRLHNNYPGWWDYCTNQGHEPYFTITKRVVKTPVVGEDDIITGYRETQKVTRRLNMVQVAIGTRFQSGRGEIYAKGLKGRKELEEFGYAPKCEYRNCEIDGTLNTKYGLFCGERHARLIGADVEGLMLETNTLQKLVNSAKKELKSLDLEYEGVYVLQTPPDIEETA